MDIIATDEFERQYRQLPVQVRRKAKKQEKFFRNDPFHPSLRTEKLEPKSKELWSFRVDRQYRILFRFLDNSTAYFLTIGTHDWIYKLRL